MGLKELQAWQDLVDHQREVSGDRIDSYFESDPGREERFTIDLGSIRLEYSRNHIQARTIDLLCNLANQASLSSSIDSMISGEIVNITEQQPALHMALRGSLDKNLTFKGQSICDLVASDREEIFQYCEDVRSGRITAASGKRFTDVVHIGIGGSAMGPQVVYEALSHLRLEHPRVSFLRNLDARHFQDVLGRVDLDSTLFIISSKSFGTEETLVNATAVRELLRGRGLDVASHFVALTNKVEAAHEFGVGKVLPVRDWIPGRLSVWGPLALPVCFSLGREVYQELLSGARLMDAHFLEAPLNRNMPAILALLSIWYTNFWGAETEAILPYSEGMHMLIPFLQQLVTESNGKSVDRNGNPVDYATAPIVWGGVGTTGQHTFYQLLHQGTRYVPCDFVMISKPLSDPHGLHDRVLANGIAQAKALTVGNRTTDTDGRDFPEHRYIPGNKPSNMIWLEALTPQTLGALIALYEHKVTVQGFVWNINSFDQWGVEIGKVLAREILEEMQSRS